MIYKISFNSTVHSISLLQVWWHCIRKDTFFFSRKFWISSIPFSGNAKHNFRSQVPFGLLTSQEGRNNFLYLLCPGLHRTKLGLFTGSNWWCHGELRQYSYGHGAIGEKCAVVGNDAIMKVSVVVEMVVMVLVATEAADD